MTTGSAHGPLSPQRSVGDPISPKAVLGKPIGPGVGTVETQQVRLFDDAHPLTLASGATLTEVDVAYETYGTLNRTGTNAVFICHALTGDAHAAGLHKDARKPGWWDSLIGPGRPVDTNRLFVICANLLGGCKGTTGPASTNPATGTSYGLDFPLLQVADFVTVHRALLAHLGVRRLLAAIGGSLGGMQVLEWALSYPGDLGNAVIIAASSRLSAQNIAFSAVAREAIKRDPGFNGGRYLDTGTNPDLGLSIARMMAHITYLSEEGMAEKFGRRFQNFETKRHGFGADFAVESYLQYQGEAFLNRFDALSYLYLTRVMDYFDPFAEIDVHQPGDAFSAVRAAGTRFCVLSFDTDWRFDTSHSRRITHVLERGRLPVTFREIASPWGHDSFLLPIPAYHDTLRAFLGRALEEGPVSWPDAGDAPTEEAELRPDLALVADLIPAGSRVLDLGCGSGTLLRHLITHKQCSGTGVDSDDTQVLRAIRRGIPVLDLDIESGLPDFADNSYDTVVMSRTLQAIRHPRRLLEEMGRVGNRIIVSVPNFGLWRNRLAIIRGHMPISKDLPHTWYDSPNVRYTTLTDLEAFFASYGFEIETRIPLVESWRPLARGAFLANLLAGSAVYVLRRKSPRADSDPTRRIA